MGMFSRTVIARRWRLPQLMTALFILEFPLTVACLTLFGIADPNTYTTKLWQNGADQGFNSNPNEILYSYANYKPINVPLVWSSFLVEFNIVISVLSMFILLVKTTMFMLHAWIPLLSALVHALLIALYAVSIRNQSAPDLSDPEHPAKGLPWMLSKGCKYATSANYGYCMQTRAMFGVTCVMLVLFTTYFGLSVWNIKPTESERTERLADREADIEMKKLSQYQGPDGGISQEEKWERNRQIFLNLPKTPNTPGFGMRNNPMTPRTVAFTALNGGQAPQAMRPVAHSPGPSNTLPFRQQFGDARVPDAR
ncbi:Hypothetical protein R9X50_00059700 [Acrodontium crateriforme]|uniref:Uncharacterized protein n=1 Tax=Acrodontium crateriforme TaxID=150365 RepID=A0AAQ3LYE4_9PEZI|nr:Hypothetical protein R9X50_00059700 [Acrodontium crateriforme]